MNPSKKLGLAALAFTALLFAGCLGFFQQESKEDQLLKFLPDESLKGVAVASVNEKGMDEIREYVGTALSSMFGGSALRQIKSLEGVVAMYEDNSTIFFGVIQSKNSLEEFVDDYGEGGLLSYWTGSSKPTKEKNELNGRTVYAMYSSYDKEKESPLCAWKEGEGIALMGGSTAYNQPKKNCLQVLQKTYSTEKAKKLLEKTSGWMNKIPSAGEEIGLIKVQMDAGGGVVKAFRDEDATYLFVMGEAGNSMPALGSLLSGSDNRNLCGGGYGDNASVVKKDGKQACRRGVSSMIILQRNGANGVSAVGLASVKGGKTSAKRAGEIIENAVFAMDLGAKDEEWRDDMDVTLNVRVKEPPSASPTPYVNYDYNAPQGKPLEGVKAELYVSQETENIYAYPKPLGQLRETKYSDAQGSVKFEKVPLSGAQVVLSKDGYEPENNYGNQKNTTISVSSYMYTKYYYFQKIEPFNVTVKVYEAALGYVGYGYGYGDSYANTGRTPLEGATVDLYEGTYDTRYQDNIAPTQTKLTDKNGETWFLANASNGVVKAHKPSYQDPYTKYDMTTKTFSRSSYMRGNYELELSLTKKAGERGAVINASNESYKPSTGQIQDQGEWKTFTANSCSSIQVNTKNGSLVSLVSKPGCQHTGAGAYTSKSFEASGKYSIDFTYFGQHGTVGANGLFIASEDAVNNREPTYGSITGDAIFMSIDGSCAASYGLAVFYEKEFPGQWHCEWSKNIAQNSNVEFSGGQTHVFSVQLDWETNTMVAYRDGTKVLEGFITETLPHGSKFKITVQSSYYPYTQDPKTVTYSNVVIKKETA